ncbi:helix-turn-helix domain-containing protein [Acinetobacter sp. P1(2025)]|uniref:helix-turn-helix domain-containing protein n=1 Tax=Acinetobacter sp. P1(2025) TaxID=3446120 RepID=UPI003F53B717
MFYGATLTSNADNKFNLTFRDFPEINVEAKSKDKALALAKEQLLEAIYIHYSRTNELPVRGPLEQDDVKVVLPVSLDAKVKLIQELRKLGLSNAEMARKLGVRYQDVQRLFDLRHNTKIDQIADAFDVLGIQLGITLSS